MFLIHASCDGYDIETTGGGGLYDQFNAVICSYDPQATSYEEETFLQNFLVILKRMQNPEGMFPLYYIFYTIVFISMFKSTAYVIKALM